MEDDKRIRFVARLRAHPEFQRHIAKLSDVELVGWAELLLKDSIASDAEVLAFLDQERDDLADEFTRRADRGLIAAIACLEEFEQRRISRQEN